jgi:hypothetical protein
LTVHDPAAVVCAYNPSWCGGLAMENVISGDAAKSSSGADKCVFFKAAGNSMNVNGNTNWLLNGQSVTGQSIHYNAGAINNLKKADGGYYLYSTGSGWYALDIATTGVPDCTAN